MARPPPSSSAKNAKFADGSGIASLVARSAAWFPSFHTPLRYRPGNRCPQIPEPAGDCMARPPNYSQDKKRREEAARKKRDEKQQRRQQKKDDPSPPAT